MTRFKLMAGVALVFFLGALAGSFGTVLYFKFHFDRIKSGRHSPQVRAELVMKRLSDDLGLAEEQEAEILKIVVEAEEKIFAIKSRSLPEIKAIHDQAFAAIRENLNPDQRRKLDSIYEDLQRFRHQMKPPPPD
ncbi:MAG: hypothetical protein AB1896_03970 [Thermodesulfobacteriota bacterium]